MTLTPSKGKLFVNREGRTMVGEFGLAALCCPFAAYAPSISFDGITRWFSPELLKRGASAPQPTLASDVWALGCTLYEILTEMLPYSEHKHDIKVQRRIVAGDLPGQCDDSLKISRVGFLWPIVESCWAPAPEDRPDVPRLAQRLQDEYLGSAKVVFNNTLYEGQHTKQEMYYFIIRSKIFGYNSQNQVFWFDDDLSPHYLDTARKQVIQPHSSFQAKGVLHRVDSSGLLWFYYDGDDQWYPALLYTSLEEAFNQLGELLQPQATSVERALTMTDQPQSPAMKFAQTNIQKSYQTTTTLVNAPPSHYYNDAQTNTATTSTVATTASHTSASRLLPTLSPTPDQEEIETWFAEFQKQRRSSKSQDGLATIVCPLPGCGHVSRRPHALKDHLFFHFDIKRVYLTDVLRDSI
ncbi:hypothetical protein FRC12_019540 [Ceratobasidium sp. 428]|nr:hypothetical protein FRC12_019540 [Ceratobasidium sp. 428]